MTRTLLILLIAVLILPAGQLTAQSPASVVLIRANRLLDPRTGKVLSPAAVLIENGKIKEVDGAGARAIRDERRTGD